MMALKILRSGDKFTYQGKSELEVLKVLQTLKNSKQSGNEMCTVTLLDHFYKDNHVCFVFPLHGLNLYDYMKVIIFSFSYFFDMKLYFYLKYCSQRNLNPSQEKVLGESQNL